MDRVQYKNKRNILCKNLTAKTLNAFFEFNAIYKNNRRYRF